MARYRNRYSTNPSTPPTPTDQQVAMNSHDQQKVLQGSREEFQQETASRRASGRSEPNEADESEFNRASAKFMDGRVPYKPPRKQLASAAARKCAPARKPSPGPDDPPEELEEKDENSDNETATTPPGQLKQLASEAAPNSACATAPESPTRSQQCEDTQETRRDTGIGARTPELLSAVQDPWPPQVDTMQDTKIKIIQSIVSDCTEAEARDALVSANGEIPAAAASLISRTMPQQENKVEKDADSKPKQQTLLDEALAAYAKKPKKAQRTGEVVIVLSLKDLDRTFVLHYEDAVLALPTLEDAQLAATETSRGGKNIYILTNPPAGKDVPTLQRREVDILRADCEEDIYQQADVPPASTATTPANSAPESGLKVEMNAGEHDEDILMVTPNSTSKPTDWIQAWETLLCIVSRLPHGIPHSDTRKALPRMEAVAKIAEAQSATSSIVDAFNGLFTRFIAAQHLWEAIAEDPARWVVLGAQIQSTLVYKEALKHLIGCYPHWPWSISKEKIPEEIISIIEAKSKQLHSYRLSIEVQLLTITLPAMVKDDSDTIVSTLVSQYINPTGYNTLNLFRDWMSNHISHLHNVDVQVRKCPYEAQKLCDHSFDGFTLAGLFRTVVAGGDAYIPVDHLLGQSWHRGNFPLKQGDEACVRLALKALKGKAAEIAKPLTVSTLQYESKEALEYLTCVEVEEGDIPWVKMEEEGEDGDVEMD